MEGIEKQNSEVRSWASSTLKALKASYIRNIRSKNRSGDGLDSLKLKTGKAFGEIDRISFGFKRYLVFATKGAGKGQGGKKGSSWINSHGNRIKTKSTSLGKMNKGSRHAKDIINPVLDNKIPLLADIVANFKAEQVIKAIKIK